MCWSIRNTEVVYGFSGEIILYLKAYFLLSVLQPVLTKFPLGGENILMLHFSLITWIWASYLTGGENSFDTEVFLEMATDFYLIFAADFVLEML